AFHRLDGFWLIRHRAAAADDRRIDGLGGVQTSLDWQAGRTGGARGSGALPTQPVAWLFRRERECNELQQLRQLPVGAAPLRRQDRRAEIIVLRLSHGTAFWRHASDRRAGRPPDRTRATVRA